MKIIRCSAILLLLWVVGWSETNDVPCTKNIEDGCSTKTESLYHEDFLSPEAADAFSRTMMILGYDKVTLDQKEEKKSKYAVPEEKIEPLSEETERQ